jgi:O-antigen ligase
VFKNKILIYYISAIIVLALAAFLVSIEKYYFAAVPFGIAILIIAIFSLKNLMYIIAFLTPLSIQLCFFADVDNDLSLPVEPILIGLFLLVLYKLVFERNSFNKKILTHPVSIAIYINLIWIAITSLTSTMPIVSWKFTVSRMWCLATFYILASHLFTNKSSIYKYFWLYASSFIIVIAYTLIRQSSFGFFDRQAANYMVTPLLPDHTSYGAILAMFIPFILFCAFNKRFSSPKRLLAFAVGVLYILALVFSYTRAAWVGVVASAALFILLALKIKARTILLIGAVLTTVVLAFSTEIMMSLEKNTQSSSDDLSEQLRSVTNISTDASNLERINRWNSAIRMFKERPIFGFGPGTYMFQYAPYQLSSERTIISTNFGDVGNAHSEFLGPLAESGLLGTVTFTLILIVIGTTTLRIYHKVKEREARLLAIALFLGLITHYVHGFLNNFLDIDKFLFVFWGFTAAIVVIDVKFTRETNNNLLTSNTPSSSGTPEQE